MSSDSKRCKMEDELTFEIQPESEGGVSRDSLVILYCKCHGDKKDVSYQWFSVDQESKECKTVESKLLPNGCSCIRVNYYGFFYCVASQGDNVPRLSNLAMICEDKKTWWNTWPFYPKSHYPLVGCAGTFLPSNLGKSSWKRKAYESTHMPASVFCSAFLNFDEPNFSLSSCGFLKMLQNLKEGENGSGKGYIQSMERCLAAMIEEFLEQKPRPSSIGIETFFHIPASPFLAENETERFRGDLIVQKTFPGKVRTVPLAIFVLKKEETSGALAQAIRQYEFLTDAARPSRLHPRAETLFPCIVVALGNNEMEVCGVVRVGPRLNQKVAKSQLALLKAEDYANKEKVSSLLSKIVAAIGGVDEFWMNPHGQFPVIKDCESIESGGQKLFFDYTGDFTNESFTTVYKASLTGSDHQEKSVVVKFAKKYGLSVHKKLDEAGFAPKLLGFQQLGKKLSDWKIAVMEAVKEPVNLDLFLDCLRNCVDERANANRVLSEAEEALWEIHKENLVHGDFRGVNILVSERGKGPVKIVDFDWSGQEGEVAYPDINPKIAWPCGGGSPIKKGHDQYFLAGYKRQFQQQLQDNINHHLLMEIWGWRPERP
eukprot:m.221916 g.221916  ORF g.221916 m.221916 type:complete len:599 (+) comp39966_c0_seq6:66-1862(+)